jgi:hypothetical protein
MSAEWLYAEDGVERDEFAESLRLPLIVHPYPRWCYITAVVVDPHLWHGIRPTDDELRAVASFHQEYVDRYYNERWKTHMRERPFDIDGGANSRYLIKYPHGGWGYRLDSWRCGPTLVPGRRDEPQDLMAVLTRAHSLIPERWQQWVDDHPEVFGAVTR